MTGSDLADDSPPPRDKPRDDVLFDAVVTPNRSLSRRGFAILMLLIGTVSFTAGVAFIMAGAWPVFGFLGLDVALIYWAFHLNYRRGQAVEYVRLTRDTLTIRRVDHRGQAREVSLPPYWLRLELSGMDVAERLTLRTHGKAYDIAIWLSPPEREEFATALENALRSLREPPALASGPAQG